MATAKDVDTLTQANQVGGTICGQSGSFTMRIVQRKYPNAEYIMCPTQAECYEHLRAGRCSHLTRDKLSLKGKAFEDPNFEVTAEEFNTYYLVWPMKYDLPPVVSYLMKRWIHTAVRNTTLDELYHKYFEKDLCPVGQSGENCDLPCDADHGAADVHGRCICESTKWSGADCSIEIEEDLNLIPSSLKILAYTMFALNVAFIVGCAGWLFSHWSSDEVRASQPHFLLLVLLGCLISTSTIVAMAQEDDSPACMTIPWLYSGTYKCCDAFVSWRYSTALTPASYGSMISWVLCDIWHPLCENSAGASDFQASGDLESTLWHTDARKQWKQ